MHKEIYLLRHGQVEERYQGICRGSLDCGLSEFGKVQSRNNIEYLHNRDIQVIITSHKKRTDFVGEYAHEFYGIKHIIDDGFAEKNLGTWQGQSWHDIQNNDYAAWKAFKDNPPHSDVPTGESSRDFINRIATAWERILELPEEKIAIVTHGIVSKALFLECCHFPIENLHLDTGCINKIHFDGAVYTLKSVNIVITRMPTGI